MRYWDQRHLVVVVNYLLFVYQLFTSYFSFNNSQIQYIPNFPKF